MKKLNIDIIDILKIKNRLMVYLIDTGDIIYMYFKNDVDLDLLNEL